MNENLLAPDQRTESWYKSRAGKFTGSRFVDVLAKTTKAYTDLINQIVVERITNDYIDSGMDSFALKWGRDVEPYARQAYSFVTGNVVKQASFINHPTYHPFVGVSPDGLIGKNGCEFKCPKDPRLHIERFKNGMNEKEFMPQVQGCIWVCEADWWDWISYDPRMPTHLQMYMQRVWRDDKYIKNLEKEVLVAEGTVREILDKFKPEHIAEILENYDVKPTEEVKQ
jgi:hypothetical protein